MIWRRKPKTAEAAAADAAKARATAVQRREAAAEAKAAGDRALEHARAMAEARQREASAREIREHVERFGCWYPRQASGGRGLSARPSFKEKVQALFATWKSTR